MDGSFCPLTCLCWAWIFLLRYAFPVLLFSSLLLFSHRSYHYDQHILVSYYSLPWLRLYTVVWLLTLSLFLGIVLVLFSPLVSVSHLLEQTVDVSLGRLINCLVRLGQVSGAHTSAWVFSWNCGFFSSSLSTVLSRHFQRDTAENG